MTVDFDEINNPRWSIKSSNTLEILRLLSYKRNFFWKNGSRDWKSEIKISRFENGIFRF